MKIPYATRHMIVFETSIRLQVIDGPRLWLRHRAVNGLRNYVVFVWAHKTTYSFSMAPQSQLVFGFGRGITCHYYRLQILGFVIYQYLQKYLVLV